MSDHGIYTHDGRKLTDAGAVRALLGGMNRSVFTYWVKQRGALTPYTRIGQTDVFLHDDVVRFVEALAVRPHARREYTTDINN